MAARTTNRAQLTEILSPKQIQSIADSKKAKIALWTGAVSSGKTIASLIAFLGAVAEAPTSALTMIIGQTLQTIERNIIVPLQSTELFGELAKHVKHTAGSPTATIMGRTVHLIGAFDARSEGRIRGSTVGLAYVDEATLVPEPFWMMLLSRLRVEGARLLATTNPDGPGHWLRREFILDAAAKNMIVFEFRLDDNPKLPEGFVADLHAQYTGLWRRRFIFGEWCVAEGAIYEMWDPERHVIRGPLPELGGYPGVGVDYGTTAVFSAHLLGVQQGDKQLGRQARLVIAREYRHDPKVEMKQLTDAEFSLKLQHWMGDARPQTIAVDPTANSFKLQLHRDGVTNVRNAKNDVLDGIRLFASLLATDRLVVHESCGGLIEEIAGYSWDPLAAERGEDRPIKLDDHSCDSARYVVTTTQSLWRRWVSVATPTPKASGRTLTATSA